MSRPGPWTLSRLATITLAVIVWSSLGTGSARAAGCHVPERPDPGDASGLGQRSDTSKPGRSPTPRLPRSSSGSPAPLRSRTCRWRRLCRRARPTLARPTSSRPSTLNPCTPAMTPRSSHPIGPASTDRRDKPARTRPAGVRRRGCNPPARGPAFGGFHPPDTTHPTGSHPPCAVPDRTIILQHYPILRPDLPGRARSGAFVHDNPSPTDAGSAGEGLYSGHRPPAATVALGHPDRLRLAGRQRLLPRQRDRADLVPGHDPADVFLHVDGCSCTCCWGSC